MSIKGLFGFGMHCVPNSNTFQTIHHEVCGESISATLSHLLHLSQFVIQTVCGTNLVLYANKSDAV